MFHRDSLVFLNSEAECDSLSQAQSHPPVLPREAVSLSGGFYQNKTQFSANLTAEQLGYRSDCESQAGQMNRAALA